MRTPIYKNKTYKFYVDITVAGVAATVTGDTITAYLDKNKNSTTPAITSVGVVDGVTTGRVNFELTPADTNKSPGTYNLQVVWLSGDESYIVADETVELKAVVKN